MGSGIIVCNGQRFKAEDIDRWRVEEHTMAVALEECIDLFWGVKFRTKVKTAEAAVRTVVVDYRGRRFVYYDSRDLLNSLALFQSLKEGELTVELQRIKQQHKPALAWHFVQHLQELIGELKAKAGN
jgi:hypothetical protein